METARELWKAAGDDLRVSDPILGSDEFVKRVLAHVEDERADQGQEPGRITFNVELLEDRTEIVDADDAVDAPGVEGDA